MSRGIVANAATTTTIVFAITNVAHIIVEAAVSLLVALVALTTGVPVVVSDGWVVEERDDAGGRAHRRGGMATATGDWLACVCVCVCVCASGVLVVEIV